MAAMDAMKSGRRLFSDRLPELDLLRFIAAFSVLLFHHIRWAESLDGTVLFQISRFGFFGVPLFFMISGFVILWSAQNKDLLEFAVSRITRLYPTFWICVCLAAIAELSLGNHVTPFRLLANLTMMPASFGATKMDGVYCALFYELRFVAEDGDAFINRRASWVSRHPKLTFGLGVVIALVAITGCIVK
jgi:peptidoglycan/LPS O-acetylase OafA/YrhL